MNTAPACLALRRPCAWPVWLATAGLVLCSGSPHAAAAASLSAPPDGAHALYLELLGKGGLLGVGYDYRFWGPLALGATASAQIVGGQRVLAISPYLAAYPLAAGHHSLFVQAGPQIMHWSVRSPGPEWSGASSLRLGGELSSGYEYRAQWLLRVYGIVSVGKGGVAPWLGFNVGWTFP